MSLFWGIRFGPSFTISNKEFQKKITYNLPRREEEIIREINGFYGLIGPDIDIHNSSSLYDLFTGDGNIQGVFFEKGNLTFIKKFIRTEKLLYEEKNGRVPSNMMIQFLFMILNKLNILPNLLGLANTSLFKVGKKIYALYERDRPYLLQFDFKNKNIDTVQKIPIQNVSHFSAHSKYNNDLIETIDYNIESNTVSYLQLNNDFQIQKIKSIKTTYLPIIHDFFSTNKWVSIIDSPLTFDILHMCKTKFPVAFDKKKPTFIHVLNKLDMTIEKYTCNESFYVFHYANHIENSDTIEIYASLYEDLDFTKLDIKGNYRKIILDKQSKTVSIERNPELEKYNLDFPICYKNIVIFRSIEKNVFNGFIVCNGIKIIKRIIFEKMSICGEPSLIMIKNEPNLIFFGNDMKSKKSLLVVINMIDYKTIFIPIKSEQPINIGFHSIFLQASDMDI
jgi:carotenoid cleavage dioxygenase-like enzyme